MAGAVVNSECVFCDIVEGRAPASVVHEDGLLVAFMDIRPVTTGHLLVVPRRHVRDLSDLESALAARMFVTAQRLATAIRRTDIHCEGINLFYADGEAAFQEVFHAHLHVIPRYGGDGFRISADWSNRPGRDELDAVALTITSALSPSD